jgi:hypothetical protein
MDRSPLGASWLPTVELYYGGAWHDVSADLGDDGVSITRGRSDEQGQPGPMSARLRLKDPTGKYSNRNPNSPLYGLLGRNTPVRVSAEYPGGIAGPRYRFYGYVVSWPPRWTRKGSPSAHVAVECSGSLRRINQGSSPLRSPLYRACSTIGTDLVAYWPCEDGTEATQFTVAVGTKPMTIAGTPSLAAYSSLLGSEALPTVESAKFTATVPAYTSSSAQVRWVGRIPAATPNNSILLRVNFKGGSLARADLTYSTGGGIQVEGFNESGTSVGSSLYAMDVDNRRERYSLEFTTSGSNVAWSFGALEAGATSAGFGTGTFTGVTIGRVSSVIVNPNAAALANLAFGHLTVEKAVTSLFSVSSWVLAGYAGETALQRIERLCDENGLTLDELYADLSNSELLGVQGTGDLPALLKEAADADGGMLAEPRSTASDLSFRTLESTYLAMQGAVTIPYTDNLLRPFEPVEDDQATRNRVTVTRNGGASATAEDTAGTLGTAEVGIYDESVTLSLYADGQTEHQAGWRLHLGTVDEPRWPVIGFDLADSYWLAHPTDAEAVIGLDLGDLLVITDPPAWLPPGDVRAIVQGYTETIGTHHWTIEFNCVPAAPYNALHWSESSTRLSGDGTVTDAAITTTTATTFNVVPPAGIEWTHAAGDYDVVIGGEQMTVTGVGALSGGKQLFTVTRSVNGVTKTHDAGSAVALYRPAYWGL